MNIAEKAVTGLTDMPETSPSSRGRRRASAIAHDIDIAMSPITLYADALLEHEPLSERARHYLSEHPPRGR